MVTELRVTADTVFSALKRYHLIVIKMGRE